MSKRTRTPVPPLGDAAISRIERGLFAALDARPLAAAQPAGGRRRGFVLAAAGLAAAVALFSAREWRRGDASSARATQISTTTSGSRIAIAGATLEVAPHSAISVGGGRDGAVVVALERGTVTCEVEPRSKRAPFIVEAGATHVTVIGTRFSVHRVGEHATVSVEHGLVEVADTDVTELVHPGERFVPGQPVTREALASEAPAGAPAPEAAAALIARVAAPELDLAPSIAARPAGPARLHPRRLAVAGDPPATRAAAVPAAARASDGSEESRPVDTEGQLAAAPVAPTETAEKAEAPLGARARSVQVLFELAAQLEVRDPEAALRIYGELASAPSPSDGGWAASSLFAAARLEAERGHAPQAKELCETYLRRFPRGPNADDARTLLARAR